MKIGLVMKILIQLSYSIDGDDLVRAGCQYEKYYLVDDTMLSYQIYLDFEKLN
jgi:hypothetical protein